MEYESLNYKQKSDFLFNFYKVSKIVGDYARGE